MFADLRAMRKNYPDKHECLREEDIKPDPFELFHEWFMLAKQKAPNDKWTETNAVCLSTATADGFPSSRMVLLKSYDPVDGFVIYTNYGSRKASEIEQNPNVALLFYWNYLSRQIRIEGRAKRTPDNVSDDYFQSRPRVSRISARVSRQSHPIDSRETLLQKQREELEYFGHDDRTGRLIPRPNYWGGYQIQPKRFEFWQGQSDRTHDRFIFEKSQDYKQNWICYRIQP